MSRRYILVLVECFITVTVASGTDDSVGECSTRLEYLESEVSKLRSIVTKLGDASQHRVKREIEQPVAFTAYIDADLHHVGINQAVPYNRVASNIGGAFNVNTRIFTAPVSGIYLFTFVISVTKSEMVAKLVVDGQNVVDAITNPAAAGHALQGVNSAAIQVNKGQSVWVVNYFQNDVSVRSDENYRFASFSGVLIKEI